MVVAAPATLPCFPALTAAAGRSSPCNPAGVPAHVCNFPAVLQHGGHPDLCARRKRVGRHHPQPVRAGWCSQTATALKNRTEKRVGSHHPQPVSAGCCPLICNLPALKLELPCSQTRLACASLPPLRCSQTAAALHVVLNIVMQSPLPNCSPAEFRAGDLSGHPVCTSAARFTFTHTPHRFPRCSPTNFQ